MTEPLESGTVLWGRIEEDCFSQLVRESEDTAAVVHRVREEQIQTLAARGARAEAQGRPT